MALGATLKTDNIGTKVGVIKIPSEAAIVIGTVGVTWAVGTTLWSRCIAWLLWWAVSWLGSRGECAGFLTA